jgi:hypothetical protein
MECVENETGGETFFPRMESNPGGTFAGGFGRTIH